MTDNATIDRRDVADDPPIVALLKQYDADLTEALPDGYTPGRFKSVCINLVRATPSLLNVDPMSFIASVLMSVEFRMALAVDGSTPRELVPDLAGLVSLEAVAEEADNE